MIKVEREQSDELGRSIRPNPNWFAEARRLTALAETERGAHQVTGHYKHDEVKKALEKLFRAKCAYCETRLGVEGSWDVEHFRPKAQVAGVAGHEGYYWLSYEWGNLYPACELCNQKRKDSALWDDPRDLPAAGKLAQFPLADESRRVYRHEDHQLINSEEPLLIDPCDQRGDPERYFGFDRRGTILSAQAGNRRAESTIQICHLNRRRLCDARADQITKIVEIVAILRLVSDQDADIRPRLRNLLGLLTDASEIYAAAARAVVRDPESFGVT
jgi:uncharacterized protein (TIGR02646 family)